ncbi:MAG: site-2 protease family protein [Oscillospiraceae bacterium]|nr:site-2 protease family protein [Oscillospiraceae bacterium]
MKRFRNFAAQCSQKLEISPGFVALLCFFYYVDPFGLFGPFLIAAFYHELAHFAACRLTGGRLIRLRLRLSGAVMQLSPMGTDAELLCALAGPSMNLLLGLGLLHLWPAMALMCLLLAVYNFLPMLPLDGGRIAENLLCRILPQRRVDGILQWCRIAILGGVFLLACVFSLIRRCGIWPLLFSVVLLAQTSGELLVAKKLERP